MSSLTNLLKELISSIKEIFSSNPVDLLEGVSDTGTNEVSYSVSEEFIGFPKYNGELIGRPEYLDTTRSFGGKNYKRVSMFFDYNKWKKEEYCNQLINEGFVKGSDVRYDKTMDGTNTYVIVEKINNQEMKVAFHISMD